MNPLIGRVIASTAQTCRAGCQSLEAGAPVLGAFVEAPIQGGRAAALGVICSIEMASDALTEQVAVSLQARARAGETAADLEAYVADQRQRPSAVPVFEVLLVGYRDEGGRQWQGLPPQPPPALAPVSLMTPETVASFALQPE